MAFLYGSWAKGYPREDSDLDIAILFHSDDVTEDKALDIIDDISVKLSQLFSKEVNILLLHQDFPNPMLQYNAIVLGIPVFIEDFEHYGALRMEAIFQMEDFSIFGRRWQLEVAERRLSGEKKRKPTVQESEEEDNP